MEKQSREDDEPRVNNALGMWQEWLGGETEECAGEDPAEGSPDGLV